MKRKEKKEKVIGGRKIRNEERREKREERREKREERREKREERREKRKRKKEERRVQEREFICVWFSKTTKQQNWVGLKEKGEREPMKKKKKNSNNK